MEQKQQPTPQGSPPEVVQEQVQKPLNVSQNNPSNIQPNGQNFGHFQPSTVVVVQGPIDLGHEPVAMVCPFCRQRIVTVVKYDNRGALFWMSVILLAAFCFFLCLCFIPCCMKSCKEAEHSCPNCRTVLGRSR